ncbi:MAG: sugar phosphate isomerase/epimerase, partial [Caldimonas sp.]
PLIEGWRALAQDAGVALHFETHRDRMTTDLLFTLRLLDRFPDLRLTGDLSHYVVGREFAWPISDENHRLMHRVIDNCWGFHGRVASREQIQLQIGFAHHREWLELFMGWWEYGFRSWRRRAPPDAVLTFLCELGPREYAMTGSDGYELSDRWEEAQFLMRLVRELWNKLELEDRQAPKPSVA